MKELSEIFPRSHWLSTKQLIYGKEVKVPFQGIFSQTFNSELFFSMLFVKRGESDYITRGLVKFESVDLKIQIVNIGTTLNPWPVFSSIVPFFMTNLKIDQQNC